MDKLRRDNLLRQLRAATTIKQPEKPSGDQGADNSPWTTRWMLPFLKKLKATIGISLSAPTGERGQKARFKAAALAQSHLVRAVKS